MSETPTPKELTHQTKHIELEAPEDLAEGQNFYDQPPFARILESVVQEDQVELSLLRYLLRRSTFPRFTKAFEDMHSPSARIHAAAKRKLYESLGLYESATGISDDEKEKYAGALMKARERLEQFPYWDEYVNTHSLGGVYVKDGSYHPDSKTKKMFLPPSYVHWVAIRLRAEKSERLYGLEEVFPQDFAGRSLAMPHIPGGSRRVRVRIKKLEAAELIQRKR